MVSIPTLLMTTATLQINKHVCNLLKLTFCFYLHANTTELTELIK